MLRLMVMPKGPCVLTIALVAVVATGCSVGSTPAPTDEDRLAGCDRATIDRWLWDSDLDGWAIGNGGLDVQVQVYLPDTQPELSAQMRQELLDQCGDEVGVAVGPPYKPA